MILFSSLPFEFVRIFFYLLSSSFTYSSFLFFQRNFNSVGGFISFESGIFFSSLFLPLFYGFFTPRFYSSEKWWLGFNLKKISKFKSKLIIQIWLTETVDLCRLLLRLHSYFEILLNFKKKLSEWLEHMIRNQNSILKVKIFLKNFMCFCFCYCLFVLILNQKYWFINTWLY